MKSSKTTVSSARSHLLRLPVELLDHILKDLSSSVVAAARLSCSELAAVGAKYLLNEVHLVFRLDRFERLETIAAHGLIAKPVKSLYYEADRFQEYDSFERWCMRDTAPEYYGEQLTSGDGSEATSIATGPIARNARYSQVELRTLYERHCALVDDQNRIYNDALDIKCLTTLFRACPDLSNINFSVGFGPRAGTTKMKTLAFSDCQQPPHGDPKRSCEGNIQLLGLCRALRAANTSITKLSISNLGFMIVGSNHNIEVMQHVMKGLHEFRLSFTAITVDGDDRDDEPFERAAGIFDRGPLYQLLSVARELRVLKLVGPDLEAAVPILSLSACVRDHTWPRLRDIGLDNLSCTEDSFIDFLLRHKDKLRNLTLADLTESEDGNWESIFEGIAGQLPKLKMVRLNGNFCVNEGGFEPENEMSFGVLQHRSDREYCAERWMAEAIIKGEAAEKSINDIVTDMAQEEDESMFGYELGEAHMEDDELYDDESGNDEMWNDEIDELEMAGHDMDNEGRPIVCTRVMAHPDAEYDSDGSYVSYGSDRWQ